MCELSYSIVNSIYSAMLDQSLSVDDLASMANIKSSNLKRIFDRAYAPSLIVVERLFTVLNLQFRIYKNS